MRGMEDSADGARSGRRIPGLAGPGAAGSTFHQLCKECKHGNEEKSEKSCEETRQEEGGAGSRGQANGEIRGASTGGSTCCSVGCGGARGKNCPESRCCLAVSDRV